MERVIDRLNRYIEYKGLNYNKVQVDCELSNGLLRQAMSGKCDLGKRTIEKILSRYTEINRTWLLTGDGDMINGDNISIREESATLDLSAMVSHIESLERRIDELLKQNGELIAMLAKKS